LETGGKPGATLLDVARLSWPGLDTNLENVFRRSPILPLPVPMVQSALRTSLMPAVWRYDAAEVVLLSDEQGCNSAVRDRSAGRSRTPYSIHCGGKSAAVEPLRQEVPC